MAIAVVVIVPAVFGYQAYRKNKKKKAVWSGRLADTQELAALHDLVYAEGDVMAREEDIASLTATDLGLAAGYHVYSQKTSGGQAVSIPPKGLRQEAKLEGNQVYIRFKGQLAPKKSGSKHDAYTAAAFTVNLLLKNAAADATGAVQGLVPPLESVQN